MLFRAEAAFSSSETAGAPSDFSALPKPCESRVQAAYTHNFCHTHTVGNLHFLSPSARYYVTNGCLFTINQTSVHIR